MQAAFLASCVDIHLRYVDDCLVYSFLELSLIPRYCGNPEKKGERSMEHSTEFNTKKGCYFQISLSVVLVV